MINETLTFEKFGYYSYNLLPNSGKRIVAVCDKCGKVRESKKQQYRLLCSSCVMIGKPGTNRGRKLSEEWRRNLSLSTKGRKRWPFGLSEEVKGKISLAIKGNGIGKDNSMFGKGYLIRRENNGKWKGGITSLHLLIRHLSEYKQWRRLVLERDGYICRECGVTEELDSHHVKKFSIILNEFLREYSQFSSIEDKETLVRLAISYKPFWDIDNGKTLCKKCHDFTKGKIMTTATP